MKHPTAANSYSGAKADKRRENSDQKSEGNCQGAREVCTLHADGSTLPAFSFFRKTKILPWNHSREWFRGTKIACQSHDWPLLLPAYLHLPVLRFTTIIHHMVHNGSILLFSFWRSRYLISALNSFFSAADIFSISAFTSASVSVRSSD